MPIGLVDLYLIDRKGAGSNPAHLPLPDAEDLGHLVEARSAKKPSYPGDPRVVVLCLAIAETTFRIRHHGPKLVYVDWALVPAPPSLPVQHGPAVIELDGQGDDDPERGAYGQREGGQDEVELPVSTRRAQ